MAAKPTTKASSPAPAKRTGKAAAAAPKEAAPKAPAAATVTLKHLAAGVAEKHGVDKKQADQMVGAVFEMLVERLKAGDKVRIAGLGVIEVKDRPARAGRNPATGEAIQIAASRKIAFRVAKDLKEAI
jgi:DNA-binding protein HU-beta